MFVDAGRQAVRVCDVVEARAATARCDKRALVVVVVLLLLLLVEGREGLALLFLVRPDPDRVPVAVVPLPIVLLVGTIEEKMP